MNARDMSRLSGRNPEPVSAIDLLSADHGRLRDLFDAFEEASRTAPEEMEVLAGEICRQLLIHNQIEQEALYPAAGQISELSFLFERALEDHVGFNATIEEIKDLETGDLRLIALVLELRDQVDQHFLDEEEIFFPEIARRMPDRLEAIGVALDELRQHLTSAESI